MIWQSSGQCQSTCLVVKYFEVEEIKLDAASEHLLEVTKACYDSEESEARKQDCFKDITKSKQAVAEASGTDQLDDVKIQRLKQIAQIKVYQSSNVASYNKNNSKDVLLKDLRV